jgi:hypothetical protein
MGADIIVIIYSICAAVAVLTFIAVIFFCVCRRRVSWFGHHRHNIPQLHVLSVPSEGIYPRPLVVQLTALHPNVDILLRIVRQEDPHPPPAANPAEVSVSGFLLYRDELVFDWPGTYYVMTHTISDDKKLSELQQFCFIVTGAVALSNVLEPPRIVPGTGEVTTFTRIQLLPGRDHNVRVLPDGSCAGSDSPQGVTYRYSIDGSFPFILYTGPFLIPLEKNQNQADILVSAVAVDGREMSAVATAALTIFPARSSFFDPTIPAPSAKLLSSGSKLYFEDLPQGVSHAGIVYAMEFLSERRHSERIRVASSSSRYPAAKTVLYRRGEMIDVAKDVARIVAWTVDLRNDTNRSMPAVYDAAKQSMTYPGGESSGGSNLPLPVMCVACADFELSFDEVPAKGDVL